MMAGLRFADRLLGMLLRVIPMACLVALFVILFGNVVSRYFQLWSIAWFDEIVEALFAFLVFIGAAALWREHEHFRVDWLEAALSLKPRRALQAFTIVLSLSFLTLMAWKGYDLAARSRALTPILSVPTAYVYAAIPISAVIMALYSLRDLIVTLIDLVRSDPN